MDESPIIDADDLPFLIKVGALPASRYRAALSFFRDESAWRRWAIMALLALAVGHILSGIIFFFAFNWNDLAPMMKFGIVGGGIIASVIAWFIAKLDSPAGQAFGIAATVLIGVMFAVLGQVYQTPALIHTPFVWWALLALPFVLASRNLAHWAVWIAILTVAVSTYANSGLRLAGEDGAANLLNIAVAGGFATGLVLLDQLFAKHMPWTRREWFRVLLVFAVGCFAFFGFGESFWGWGRIAETLSWALALAISIGLLAYLYKFKPTLATLSLAAFGLFTLIAQFGFKLFEGMGDDVGIFLILTLWLGGLTVGLVQLFRHFMRYTKTKFVLGQDSDADTDKPEMRDHHVLEFAQAISADPAPISQAILDNPERHTPWYMSLFLAIAGILTAIVGCLFVGSFVGLILANASGYVFAVIGLVIFAGAILFRRKSNQPYLQHILNTLIIIGGIIAAIGLGIEVKNFDGIIFILLALSLVVLIAVPDRILEFLAAGAIITLIGVELYHIKAPWIESIILILSTAAGVVCLTQPIGKRLFNAAGTAFLIAPAILGIALVHIHRWDSFAEVSRFSDDIIPRLISVVVLIAAVFFLNQRRGIKAFKPPLLVLIPLVIGAAIVPLGGASALLLMLAGYILGSRSLAVIGTLLQIYFLYMFYYDLSLDLLSKSIILFASGVIFLCVWLFIRRQPMEASS